MNHVQRNPLKTSATTSRSTTVTARSAAGHPGTTLRRARPARWPGAWSLAVCVLSVVAIPSISASASADDKDVPVSGAITGTVTALDAARFVLQGNGVATRLGRSDYAGTVTIESVDETTGAITDTLIETLTAANGDTLTIRCRQIAQPLSPGVYQGADKWTVIGGTGRFANATGEGTATTDVDLNTGIFSKRLTGWISR